MKTIQLFLLFSFFTILIVLSTTIAFRLTYDVFGSDLKLYTNAQLGISLEHPSDWKIVNLKDGFRVLKEINLYVEVRSNELPATIDLKQYVEDYFDSRQESRKDFHLITLSPFYLPEDNLAYNALYTFTKSHENDIKSEDGVVLKVFRIITSLENKEYTFAYVSDILKYDSNLDTAKKIIKSIDISKNLDDIPHYNLDDEQSTNNDEEDDDDNKSKKSKNNNDNEDDDDKSKDDDNEDCDDSYPTVCITSDDLDCKDVGKKNFKVRPPDPNNFDGDGDGIGCES